MTSPNRTERRAVVMGVTGGLAFAAGALLAGLRQHDAGFSGDVLLFHDGVTAAQQAAFLRLYPAVRFVPFGAADVAARLGLPVDHPGLAAVLARGSALMLAKLEMPALLDRYDRCVWLDADILVRGPWGGVWDFGALAWRPLAEGAAGRRAATLARLADLPLAIAVPLPNGGVVGVSRRLPDGAAAGLWALARRLVAETEADTVDELAFWLFAASRGVPVTRLPMGLNHPVNKAGAGAATLVHAIGPHKFWNAAPLRQLWPDWQAHQAKWVAAGGDGYDGPLLLADVHPEDPGLVMQAAAHRADWLALYNGLRDDLPMGLQVDPRLDRKYMRLTFAGLPASRHLRLSATPNPRRILLDLRLERTVLPAVLAILRHEVADLRTEAEAVVSLPRTDLPRALLAVTAAVLPG